MPECTNEWKDIASHGTMFPKWIKDRGLSVWETDFCPWWLDYPQGQRPRCEEDHYRGITFAYKNFIFFALIFVVLASLFWLNLRRTCKWQKGWGGHRGGRLCLQERCSFHNHRCLSHQKGCGHWRYCFWILHQETARVLQACIQRGSKQKGAKC